MLKFSNKDVDIMKYIVKIIIVIAVFTVGFYFGFEHREESSLSSKSEVNSEEKNKNLSLMLDFGDGRVKTFNDIAILDSLNVFELLEKVSLDNDFELKYKDTEMGVFIEAINGVENDFKANKYWQFWVNNRYSKVGASTYSLKGGEIVEWKYLNSKLE